MKSKAIVGKVTGLLALLALVVGVGVVMAQDAPGDVTPPVVCGHGGAIIPVVAAGVAHNLNHVAPCSWLVKFAGTGKWKLESGPVPVVVLKAFHYPLCKVTQAGVIKGTAECAVVVKAEPGTPEGKSWRVRLTEK